MGSEATKSAEIRANVANVMGGEANSSLLEYLNRNSYQLDELVENFTGLIHNQTTRIPVRCFYETRETHISNAVSAYLRSVSKILLKSMIVCSGIQLVIRI